MAFDHSSLRWFETSPCRAAPEGPPSSSTQHRTPTKYVLDTTPHRSVLEALPHTAPTWVIHVKPLIAASRILSSPFNASSCLCVQVADVSPDIPLGHRPSLQNLRPGVGHTRLFGSFFGTIAVSDSSAKCMSGLRPQVFPDRHALHLPS